MHTQIFSSECRLNKLYEELKKCLLLNARSCSPEEPCLTESHCLWRSYASCVFEPNTETLLCSNGSAYFSTEQNFDALFVDEARLWSLSSDKMEINWQPASIHVWFYFSLLRLASFVFLFFLISVYNRFYFDWSKVWMSGKVSRRSVQAAPTLPQSLPADISEILYWHPLLLASIFFNHTECISISLGFYLAKILIWSLQISDPVFYFTVVNLVVLETVDCKPWIWIISMFVSFRVYSREYFNW